MKKFLIVLVILISGLIFSLGMALFLMSLDPLNLKVCNLPKYCGESGVRLIGYLGFSPVIFFVYLLFVFVIFWKIRRKR